MSVFRIDNGGAVHRVRPLQPPPDARPTLKFRLRAWREFERALDPLGQPRPLPRADCADRER